MGYDYNGKLVIVTGGNGQVGQVVVKAYNEAGAKVVIGDRFPPKNKIDSSTITYQHLEVLKEESVKNFFEETELKYGKIEVLVNTIGGYHAGDEVSMISLENFEAQIELNLKSAFLLTKYAVETMSRNGGGKIIHFSSRAAVEKGVKSFAYSVSKMGVVRLVEAAAAETLDKKININAVMPSRVDTPSNRAAMPDADFSNWPTPEEISRILLFLTSPDAALISGAAIPLFGRV